MNGLVWSFIKVISGFFVSLPILVLNIDFISQAVILMVTFAIYYFLLDKIKERVENGKHRSKKD